MGLALLVPIDPIPQGRRVLHEPQIEGDVGQPQRERHVVGRVHDHRRGLGMLRAHCLRDRFRHARVPRAVGDSENQDRPRPPRTEHGIGNRRGRRGRADRPHPAGHRRPHALVVQQAEDSRHGLRRPMGQNAGAGRDHVRGIVLFEPGNRIEHHRGHAADRRFGAGDATRLGDQNGRRVHQGRHVVGPADHREARVARRMDAGQPAQRAAIVSGHRDDMQRAAAGAQTRHHLIHPRRAHAATHEEDQRAFSGSTVSHPRRGRILGRPECRVGRNAGDDDAINGGAPCHELLAHGRVGHGIDIDLGLHPGRFGVMVRNYVDDRGAAQAPPAGVNGDLARGDLRGDDDVRIERRDRLERRRTADTEAPGGRRLSMDLPQTRREEHAP